MSAAKTSVDGLREHRDSGRAGKQALRVMYQLSIRKGGMTRGEIAQALNEPHGSVCARVNELIKVKKLEDNTSRKCKVSGKTAKVVTLSQTTVKQLAEDIQGKKEASEVKYWAKLYRGKKIGRAKLSEVVKKRGEGFRQALNKELGL